MAAWKDVFCIAAAGRHRCGRIVAVLALTLIAPLLMPQLAGAQTVDRQGRQTTSVSGALQITGSTELGDIRELKTRLARAGYDPGPPDRPFDQRTYSALLGYLLEEKLVARPETGADPPRASTAIPIALAHLRAQQGPVEVPAAPAPPTAALLTVTPERQLVAARTGVQDLVFDPSGARLATISEDNTVSLWDATTGDELAILRPGNDSRVGAYRRLCFVPDGKSLASLSGDGSVQIWSLETTKLTGELREGKAWPVAFSFAPDGMRLLVTWSDELLRQYDTSPGAHGQLISVLGHATTAAVFSAGSQEILAANAHANSPFLHVVDAWTATGIPMASWTMQNPRHDDSMFDSISPVFIRFLGRDTLVAATTSGALMVLDWPGGSEAAYLRADDDNASLRGPYPVRPSSLLVNADGRRLALTFPDGRIALWTVDASNTPVFSASEFRSRLRDYQLHWRQAEAGGRIGGRFHRVEPMPRQGAAITDAVFTPDGQFLLAVSADGVAKAWDSATGGLAATIETRPQSLLAIAITPDGRRVATGGADGVVKLWQLH